MRFSSKRVLPAHLFALGVGPDGERVYVPRDSVPVADLLAGPVPSLDAG
jgi:hypothetical protein